MRYFFAIILSGIGLAVTINAMKFFPHQTTNRTTNHIIKETPSKVNSIPADEFPLLTTDKADAKETLSEIITKLISEQIAPKITKGILDGLMGYFVPTAEEKIENDLDLKGMNATIHTRLDTLNTTIHTRLDTLNTTIHTRFDSLNTTIHTSLDKMNTRMDTLTEKMDSNHAELTKQFNTLHQTITLLLTSSFLDKKRDQVGEDKR